MKDVAAAAGCSVAVASRALSPDAFQNRTVAQGTAAAVTAAARQLGYNPRRHRARKRPVGVIGVFIPPVHSNLVLQLMSGIFSVAVEYETPLHFYSNGSMDSYRHFMREYLTLNRNLGILSYYPAESEQAEAFLEMYEKIRSRDGQAVVIHNDVPAGFPGVSVRINNYSGGRLAGEYLGAMNLNEYFAIVWPEKKYRHVRMDGFCDGLKKYHRNPTIFWGQEHDYDKLIKQLERIYQMVDWKARGAVGLFCDSDYTALLAHGFFQQHGIRIGSQIKLVGYDDMDQTVHSFPRITTVRQPFAEMGSLAVRKLFNLMKGFREESAVLEPELIVRESS